MNVLANAAPRHPRYSVPDDAMSRSLLDAAARRSDAAERRAVPFRTAAACFAGAPRYVLAGKGPLGRHVAARLAASGHPPLAFVDNDRSSWGTTVAGVPVVSPGDGVRTHGTSAVFIVTIYNGRRVREQLASLGCAHLLHVEDLFFGMPATFLPFYQVDRPDVTIDARDEVAAMAAQWDDAKSRDVYAALIARRVGLQRDDPEIIGAARDCYFDPELFALRSDDCIVDCGAFDGDTVRWLLANAPSLPRKIVALEPDPSNAAALREFIATLGPNARSRIVVHELAASARAGFLAFNAAGTVAASAGAGSARVAAASLDELVLGDAPTVIKMDVEGHELSALQGAVETIRMHSPVLAISLYHRCTDLWRIPLFIRRIAPSYRLHLRCYAEDGWESVCYAVPPARSRGADE